MTDKKKLIISGINFFEGGPLSLLKDCLSYLDESNYAASYDIVALVSKVSLYQDLKVRRIKFIEFPSARENYIKRLFYEYYYFFKLSKEWKPDLWFSLHDITPNVISKKQVVYCHNPAPFYSLSFKEFLLEPKFGFFNHLYKFVYRKNIKRNAFVIVQQDWLREKFATLFKIDKKKIIVAHPNVAPLFPYLKSPTEKKIFIFPTLPRVFKNIEILGESASLLHKRGISNFEIIITIHGTENKYAKWIKKNYGHLTSLRFIGKQTRERIFELYAKADCLIFPSKLETWGLPISEFKQTNKQILLADLPYAHETIGDYESVCFFDPLAEVDLANKMEYIITHDKIISKPGLKEIISPPMANNWDELFQIILQ